MIYDIILDLLDERDYTQDKIYQAKPEQKKRRAQRNAARRKMVAKHGKAALNGKDVDHKDRNPHNNGDSNLRIQSPSINRGRNR